VPPRLPGLTKSTGLLRHPFDEANGVCTSGLIAGRHLKSGHCHDRHATAYYGVAPSVFQSLLARWQRTRSSESIQDFTFVDIGAGMGRAMLLASQQPFRQVLGVELHSTLVRTGRRNLTIWRKSGRAVSPLRLTLGDATQFRFPPGPCVCFLFNPFGASVMRRLLRHLAATFADRPGQLDLLYVNNEQEGELECHRGFRRLYLGKVRRSPEDNRADRAILTHQPEGEYASHPYEDCSIWRFEG
jgi:hypothetical protein